MEWHDMLSIPSGKEQGLPDVDAFLLFKFFAHTCILVIASPTFSRSNKFSAFSGAWLNDDADTKYLAFDGYFVALYYLHLATSALMLHEKVKSVPLHWIPASLSRFIQNYGTHIIVGMAIGGQDLVCVRQQPSSMIPPAGKFGGSL
ncbi:hypothetical protein Nepgr_009905 [Nepenthes gracilis]|uniref:MACPF domain-containing protein n=1 Tax=Nepenthes gracilis TaxID=150966 RepID=A0AAD3SC83_NEPGR|nr:hypothetical protein Nepgr_009905 [Nepenthes gracilis]